MTLVEKHQLLFLFFLGVVFKLSCWKAKGLAVDLQNVIESLQPRKTPWFQNFNARVSAGSFQCSGMWFYVCQFKFGLAPWVFHLLPPQMSVQICQNWWMSQQKSPKKFKVKIGFLKHPKRVASQWDRKPVHPAAVVPAIPSGDTTHPATHPASSDPRACAWTGSVAHASQRHLNSGSSFGKTLN